MLFHSLEAFSKLDDKGGFLQNHYCSYNIFSVLPKKTNDRGNVFWLLSSVSMTLLDANEKGQVRSNALMSESEFLSSNGNVPIFYTLWCMPQNQRHVAQNWRGYFHSRWFIQHRSHCWNLSITNFTWDNCSQTSIPTIHWAKHLSFW